MTIHEDLVEAWSQRGLTVLSAKPASGKRSAPNPTDVTIRFGPRRTRTYKVFGWNITHEGKGRTGDNLRVQATSFGGSNTPVQVDRSVVCVGRSDEYGVFVGFDAWVKRQPGTSSSVHIRRDLLQETKNKGIARGGYSWDPRLGFTPAHADQHLPWVANLWSRKTIPVRADLVSAVDADKVVIEVDPWRSQGGYAVRLGDRVAVYDSDGHSPDPYLWRVIDISTTKVVLPSGRNRFHYRFTAEKSAKVKGELEQP